MLSSLSLKCFYISPDRKRDYVDNIIDTKYVKSREKQNFDENKDSALDMYQNENQKHRIMDTRLCLSHNSNFV